MVMINGNHIEIEAEWIKSGLEKFGDSIKSFQGNMEEVEISSDLSGLEGEKVRVKLQMRGAKLYSL